MSEKKGKPLHDGRGRGVGANEGRGGCKDPDGDRKGLRDGQPRPRGRGRRFG